MKKLFLLAILSFSMIGFSQENNESSFWENVRFGGAVGLNFGNNTTNIAVLPTAIYQFNESVALGVNLGYQYSKRNDVKSNVYSAGILSFFNPIYEIQLSAEFEQLFVNSTFGDIKNSYNYPSLYLGGAYQISNNFAIGMRYDVLYDNNKSIYGSAFSPIVRVFF
ncbi:hypothetical protein [Tenacibaculum sp. 190524A05c]|uniref:Alpha-ketoglutarate decarboxylase n=1 Tax=Tenacibaculum platacis TaxID=3137852 RepID=A0ABM9NY90_9FLAO